MLLLLDEMHICDRGPRKLFVMVATLLEVCRSIGQDSTPFSGGWFAAVFPPHPCEKVRVQFPPNHTQSWFFTYKFSLKVQGPLVMTVNMYPRTSNAKCRVYIFSAVRSMGTLYTPIIYLASFGVSCPLNFIHGLIPRTYKTN